MILKLRSSLFLTVFITAVSIPPQILCSTSPTQHSPTLHKPSNKPPIVYTAEKSREEAYPSYKQPTIATNLGQMYDEIQTEESNNNKNEPENAGFVEPLDFNSFLSDVSYKGKKSDNLPLFTSESNAKDTFAGFFGSGSNNKGRDSFVEPNFGGLSSAASDQKSRKHGTNNEDDSGFVDPNVQFRSLFESSETADGFRPQDFLGSKSTNVGADPSKSQTRAFPQYTYTGRQDNEEDDYESQPNNKYRSSYRQVNSRDRPSSSGSSGSGSYDPYDDRNYYGGENDDSPAPPPNPKYQNSNNNNRYQHRNGEEEDEGRSSNDRSGNNNNDSNNNYSPAVQESSHKPQASASGPKTAESGGGGKGKCKKIQKQVEYSEDYGEYVDPEPDYDPSSYGGNDRYKRQAGGRGKPQQQRGNNKQPMTCYVCQDEQGRYAERCSFDSKADPKQGSYFTSSSTSFTDNGRPKSGGRGNGGSERYRRNPSLSSKITPTSTAASASAHVSKTSHSNSERDKRQSPGNGGRNNNNNNNNNNNSNDSEYDYNDNSAERNGGGGNDDSYDDYNGEDYGSGSQRRNEYDTPSNTQRSRGNGNDDENYGFGPPQRGNRNGNGRNGGNEFDFGPPADFGSTTAGSNNNDRGFEFDFSIPRDFESDANLGTSNTNNRPVFSGNNNGGGFGGGGGGPGFDSGYEDYIKKYFPEAFDERRDGSTPGPSPSSSSYRPHGHSSSSPSPSHSGHSPNKEHTQQSHHYAPAPYYGQGHGHGHGQEHGTHLDKLMGAFNHKDRNGCEKVNKGDMTCYICRDSKGMNKEECMYASGDPNGKNTRMAYHESTEYSSPSASVLPLPKPVTSAFTPQSHQLQASSQSPPIVVHKKVIKEESKIVESKKKSPVDYDFDY